MKQKSLFKNTVYKAILSLFNIVVPLIVGPYIVRILDVDLYGMYNKVYSEFQIFLIFASFGIYTFGVREISKIRDDKEKVSKLFSNLCLISLITNSVVVILYILYSVFFSNGLTTVIYLLMTIQIVGNIFYIEFVNEALENYKFITIKSAIIKLMYLVALLLFVKKPDDIIIYTVIICMTVFLNNIVSFIYAKRRIKFNFDDIKIKKYLKAMTFILVIENADLLYSQLDRVMLGKLVSDVSVTNYYISYYLVSTVVSIPYAIINVSIPRLSYILKNQGKDDYVKLLKKSFSSLLFIIVPCCLGMFVLAKEIILLYAGDKYAYIYTTMMIACIVRIIISIQSVFTNLVMYPNNEEKQLLKFCMGFGFINVIFNLLLVVFDMFNPFTAMLTTGIAIFMFTVAQYIYARRKLGVNLLIMEGSNKVYILLSLLFIPISMFIRLFKLPFFANMALIMIVCVILYVGVLYIRKDDNLLLIFDKLFGKLKKFVKRGK